MIEWIIRVKNFTQGRKVITQRPPELRSINFVAFAFLSYFALPAYRRQA